MNKLQMWLLIPGIVAITTSSCKKDENDSAEPSPLVAEGTAIIAGTKSCVLAKFTYGGGDYETIEYDTKNRPVKVNYFDSFGSEGYAKITYTATDVVMDYYDEKNVKEETYVYKLGSNGYIASSLNTYTYNSGNYTISVKATGINTHNSEGFLTKEEHTSVTTSNEPGFVTDTDKSTVIYTYTDGNLTSAKFEGDGYSYVENYDYDLGKVNNLPLSDDETLSFLIGKKSKNLVKSETFTSGKRVDVDTHTYTFNTNGLVDKKTTVSVSKENGTTVDTDTETYVFEYTCK